MPKADSIESFSITNINLRDVAGEKSHIFTHDNFIMVINGCVARPSKGVYIRNRKKVVVK